MRNLQRFFVVVALIAGLPAAAQSPLQVQTQLRKAAEDTTDGPPPLPLHVSASLTHSVGSGTFIVNTDNNPTVSSALTLNPSLSWGGFTWLVNQSFGIEYTQSDSTTNPNQVEMSDTLVGVRYTKLALEDLNVSFVPSVGYALPLSLTSRNVGSLGSITGGVRAIWNAPDYGLSFYGAASTGFTALVPALSQRFQKLASRPTVDDAGNDLATAGCNPRNDQELSSYACLEGGLPSIWRWGSGVGASWTGLDDQLSVSLDLGFAQGFSSYFGPDDEFTADNARVGWTPRQSTSGNLSVTWGPLAWLSITGGINSSQGLFTNNCYAADADAGDACNAGELSNEHVRFPFFDFETPRDNNSSVYIDTSVSF
jgi:hypothetical protein